MTICTQWAWKPGDKLKSLKEVVDILVQTAGGGGNLLLNVGPMPDGRIEPRQADRLRELGAWLAKNGDSIYGTKGGPFRPEKWGCSTSRGDTVYVHILKRPGNRLSLPGGVVKVQSAALMDGTPVPVAEKGDELVLDLKGTPDDPLDLIVVLKAAPKS
jgi:alpha-L-fucosidase